MSTIDDKAATLLEKPSLEGLSFLLRHREYWPDGFKWDYSDCDTCAIGLARLLLKEVPSPSLYHIYEALKVNSTTFFMIFYGMVFCLDKPSRAVTPEDVADAIDAVLAKRAA